jgi:GTP cyclohydrolase IA
MLPVMSDDRTFERQYAERAVGQALAYLVGCGFDHDTPARVIRAYEEMLSGYKEHAAEILATRFPGVYDEIVVLRDIEFYSVCEHHLLPFSGVAAVGYMPTTEVVGISKLARLVDCYARRLQLQERLTSEIAHALYSELSPKGAACIVRAHHLCMGCRGVKKPSAELVTSAMLGLFRDESRVRAEFMELVQ